MSSESRPVVRIVTAHQQREGAGFLVRRPFPTQGLDQVDPFLMLDEIGPVDYGPGEAVGAPDHPHRGFETVSYVLEGEKLHEDSSGATQILGAGDVQWMTAGAGVVHSEMPSPRVRREGGRSHAFQIWVNLPAAEKWSEPRYQHLEAGRIPSAESPDGRIQVTVIAGEAFGVVAGIDTYTPIVLQDWRVAPGAAAEQPLAVDYNAAVYVFYGAIAIGEVGERVAAGQLALLGDGGSVRVAATADAGETGRFLLLAGRPIAEPMARYGPFVMNTKQEIMDAIQDYQSGRMGAIAR
ncbi:MAG: pirin family protein [Alphaproteobacteria bacterium]|jgi:hypothetical protein|nr:pirin family protein [Alphaproteobacteria bacterium]